MNRKWHFGSVALTALLVTMVASGCAIGGGPDNPTPGPQAAASPRASGTPGTPMAMASGTAMMVSPTAMAMLSPTAMMTTTGGPLKSLKVGVIETTVQPALEAAIKGFKDQFAAKGYTEGTNISFDVKQGAGDAATLSQIATVFFDPSKGYDMVLAVGTAALKAAVNEGKANPAMPIIFVAISDPYGAGIGVKSPTDHPANITGIQDSPPVTDALKLVLEVLPNVKNVGLLWNPSEPNSTYSTDLARSAAASLGLNLIEQTTATNDDLGQAANALADKGAQVFFVSTTNSVVQRLPSIAKVSGEREPKIPLFGNDFLSAGRGAVAAYGLDYSDSGMQAADLALQVAEGKTVKEIAIKQQTKTLLYVNTYYAGQQAVKLPDAVKGRAAQVIDSAAPTALPATPVKK